MTDVNRQTSWQACDECRGGEVVLFTTVQICRTCHGTGLDLSDARLDALIESPPFLVRTRKGLKRQGVETLRQLVWHAVAGRLRPGRYFGWTCIEEVRRYLQAAGLPAGPELVRPSDGHDGSKDCGVQI